MAKPPQLLDHLHWDVFIRVETPHSLCSLVLANLSINLLNV